MLLMRHQAGIGYEEITKAEPIYQQAVADHHCCPTIQVCPRCKGAKTLDDVWNTAEDVGSLRRGTNTVFFTHK